MPAASSPTGPGGIRLRPHRTQPEFEGWLRWLSDRTDPFLACLGA
jgi:hypothetical protein